MNDVNNIEANDNKCHFIKPNGTRCKAYRLKDQLFCYLHAGGDMHQGGTVKADEIIENPVCMKKFIGKVMMDTLKGKVAPMVANSVFVGADKALKCMQLSDIDAKMDRLMAQLQGDQGYVLAQDMDCLDIEPESDKNESKAIESKDK